MKIQCNIFFIFILFFKFIYSIEDNCYNNLFQKVIDSRYTPYDASTVCSGASSIGYPFACDSNGYITSLPISDSTIAVSKQNLYWDDFSCFSKLTQITLQNTLVEENFLYNINRSLTSLKISLSNITQITKAIPAKISSFNIDSVTGYIPASYLYNISSLSTGDYDFSFYSDGNQTGSSLKSFFVVSSKVADISGFDSMSICNFQFIGVPANNEPSITNLDSYVSRCSSITISGKQSMDFTFPHSWETEPNPVYSSMTFGNNMLLKTQNYIDLSNNINKQSYGSMYLSFAYSGNNFNIDGQFPFIGFPKNYQSLQFDYYGGNITSLPDLNIFKGLTTALYGSKKTIIGIRSSKVSGLLPSINVFNNTDRFDISGNQISGSISESWCKGVDFNFQNNLLSNSLPLCFYCHIGNSNTNSRLIGNNFTNFIAPTDNSLCNYKSIIPNLEITSNLTTSPTYFNFYIYGDNLGYENSNLKFSLPISSLTYSTMGYQVSGSLNNPAILKSFNMTIVSLNLTYTFSSSLTEPIVDQFIQNNDTLTFIGSFFTYNSSDTIITVDNYQQCVIENTSFYQIDCRLQKQLRNRGITPITIKVKKLSKTFSIDLKYITYDCYEGCSNGYCNTINGTCECNPGYTNVQGYSPCSVALHYASAVTPVPSETRGNITIFGWFGSIHNGLTVKVGNNDCPLISYDDNHIVCTVEPGKGLQIIQIVQNTITFIGKFYPYYDSVILCPNNCTSVSNGNCLYGQCQCTSGYTGIDCSFKNDTSTPLPPTSLDINYGLLSFSNEQTDFFISIEGINEMDISGNIVDSWMLSTKWNPYQNPDDGTLNPLVSTFIQNRDTENSNTSIILIIEEVQKKKEFNFANVNFSVDSGGVKFTTQIKDWDYKSSLNTIQLVLSTTSQFTKDPCLDHDESIESSSSSSQISNNVNYLKIIKDSKVLFGRFLDKMISDSKITTIETRIANTTNDKTILEINLPHCNECILDPDFQVLINPSYQQNSNNSCSNKKSWILPVAIVIPVVCVSIIIVVSVLIYRKNRIGIKVGLRNVSMRSFTDRSRK